MNSGGFACAAWAAALVSTIALGQTTIHVAPPAAGGSDTNPGTRELPVATIQRAAAMAAAGDTVLIGAGTYAGFNVGGGVTAEGAAGAPITFRGVRDAASGAWQTVIDTEAARFNGTTHRARVNIDTASWVVIEDLEVVGVADQRVSKSGVRAVMPPTGSDGHITIRRCHIHHNGEWGVFTGHVHHVTVEECLIHSQVDEHGVYLSNSGDDHVVRNNVIHSNSSNGIHVNSDASQGGDGVMRRVLIERNTLYGNGGGSTYIDSGGVTRTSLGGGSAVNFDGVRDSTIVNNVIYDQRASGISLYRIDGLLGAGNNLVVNNTIINATSGRWCLNISDGSTGNMVLNNILLNYHSFRGSVIVSADSLSGLISDYNIVMDRMDPGVGSPRTLAQWRTATSQDAHSIALPAAAWPGTFASLATGDLRLSETSAARDAGAAVLAGAPGAAAPEVDRDGLLRPAGAGFDIGAHELGGVNPTGCVADFNGDSMTSVQDVFDFLAAYFGGDPRADVNGMGGIGVQDVFDFLEAWFEGC